MGMMSILIQLKHKTFVNLDHFLVNLLLIIKYVFWVKGYAIQMRLLLLLGIGKRCVCSIRSFAAVEMFA